MPLLRVAIAVDAAEVEPAIAAWERAGVRNSSVEFQFDEPTEEPWPGHDNRALRPDRAEVAAYLDAEHWRRIEPSLRAAAMRALSNPQIDAVAMPDRDWRTAWHDHFDIVRVPGPRPIIVRPPHIAYDAKPDDVVVDLVPGLAFGTGQHQSTRLCLKLLAELIAGGEQVLDVGTGSGILAVAAAKLGAASVVATDIDPLAVDAARQTVRRNRLSDRVEVREGSIPNEETYDLVVANLTADILQWLATDIAAAVAPGGRLIASGFIEPRSQQVSAALRADELEVSGEASEDEWRALTLRRPHRERNSDG